MRHIESSGSRRRTAAGLVAGAVVLLLAGCSSAPADNDAADPGPSESQPEQTTQAPQPPEETGEACESALSAAVETMARAFGGPDAETGEFSLAPAEFPADWAAALPADVSSAACARELTWEGDIGTVVAFTATAEELAAGMDVTQLKAYQDAGGANINIEPGPEALGLPIDLSEYPDQASVAPYRLVVMALQ